VVTGYDDAVIGGGALLGTLHEVIQEASGAADGRLTLRFPSCTVSVLDSNASYESYQVRHGDQLSVV